MCVQTRGYALHWGIPFLYIFTNRFQFSLISLLSLKRERDPACLTIAGSYDILFKNLKKRVKRCIDFPADKTKYAVMPWFHSVIASVAGKLKSSSLRIRSCPDGGITCFCCAERAARIDFLAALIFLF